MLNILTTIIFKIQVGSRVYDVQEIQRLIPQLEQAAENKDKQLQQAQNQIEEVHKRQ